MKKCACFFLLCLTFFMSNTRIANAGIPVLSPSELVQAVLEYTQVLKDYEEQIELVKSNYEQYEQMQKDYIQALKEWDQVLEQAQAYRDLWGDYNWDKFVNEMSIYFKNKNSYSDSEVLKLYEDENYRNSRTLVMTKYGKVYTYEDAKKMIDKLNAVGSETLYQDALISENQFNTAVNQQDYYLKKSDDFINDQKFISKLQDKLEELGDNSQLATSQYQAQLQINSISFQLKQMEMLNELISNQNELSNLHATKMLQSKQRQLEKANNATTNKLNPNNDSQLVDF